MTEHNKSYPDKEEFKRRYTIFQDNMKKVQFLRETELGTGEYGATALSDLTETEFKQNYLGWKKQRDDPEIHWPAAEIPDVSLPKVCKSPVSLPTNQWPNHLPIPGARLEEPQCCHSGEEPGRLWIVLGFLGHRQCGRTAGDKER